MKLLRTGISNFIYWATWGGRGKPEMHACLLPPGIIPVPSGVLVMDGKNFLSVPIQGSLKAGAKLHSPPLGWYRVCNEDCFVHMTRMS